MTALKPPEPVLQIRVRGQAPFDLNTLLRLSSHQRGATAIRRKFQKDQRVLMRAQNALPRKPLEGPLHVRFCRIHEPKKAVDIDNATAGLKTILDGLAEEGVLKHDGPGQIPEIARAWQAVTRDRSEVGFFLELVRPGSKHYEARLSAAAHSLLAMVEHALKETDEVRMRLGVQAAVEAARNAGLATA